MTEGNRMKSSDRVPEKVYCYMPVHRLWEVLAAKSLYFMNNSKWDDPFEGFLVKRYCKTAGRDYARLNSDKFFLCCSIIQERDHQGVRGVRSQHLTNPFKGYRRTDEVASKDPTKTGCPPSLIASARQPPTPKGFGGLKTSLFIMACRDVALAFIRRRSRSLVEAAGIEPASENLPTKHLHT